MGSLSQHDSAGCISDCARQNYSDNNAIATEPWWKSIARRLDYRMIIIGALLPDIIDKPLGGLLFRDFFSNTRILGHTLLFLAIITVLSFWLYRARGQVWLIFISFGTLMHFILDSMWRQPQTLLWPLYGLSFQRYDMSYWFSERVNDLLTNPAVYIPEIVGAIILVIFMVNLFYRKKGGSFIMEGS